MMADATTLQWLDLVVNMVGVAALIVGAVRVGKILTTIEVHSKELEENQRQHSEIWARIWEIKK